MGEKRQIRENVIGGQLEVACCVKDNHIQIDDNVDLLHSFIVDKLIYVHDKAFDYNRWWFTSVLKTDLKFRSIKGVVAL